jgi:hypothetical protein
MINDAWIESAVEESCRGQIWGSISTLVWRDRECPPTSFHGNRFSGWYLKAISPEYETRTLATRLHIWFPVSVTFILILCLPSPRFRYSFLRISCLLHECRLPCPYVCHTNITCSRIQMPTYDRALNITVYDDMNVLKLITLFSAFCRWVFVIASAHC